MAEDNQPGEGELLAVPAAILEEPEERPSTVGGSPTRRTRDHFGGHLATWFAHRSHASEEVEHSCAQYVRDGSWDAHNDESCAHV